jgi:hypothetical protein
MQEMVQKGRVTYHPMCTYDEAAGRITSRLNRSHGWPITVNRKVVNATYLSVRVPGSVSRWRPPFQVDPEVDVVPANKLTEIEECHPSFVVIGAGRTGMDAVLVLLNMGVSPSMVQWVVPRDMWCFCHEAMLPDRFSDTMITFQGVLETATSNKDMLTTLEQAGIFCRVHDDANAPFNCSRHPCGRKNMEDMAFHGTQVTKEELRLLRQVTNIIRLGHVKAIHADQMVLDKGTVPQVLDTLYIDCTSSWASRDAYKPVPIFAERKICIQWVSQVQNGLGDQNPCFAASLIGYLEGQRPDDNAWKNNLCLPGFAVDTMADWLKSHAVTHSLQTEIMKDRRLSAWTVSARPSNYAAVGPRELQKVGVRWQNSSKDRVLSTLFKLIAEAEAWTNPDPREQTNTEAYRRACQEFLGLAGQARQGAHQEARQKDFQGARQAAQEVF